MRAVPRSCWAAKRVLFASDHGTGNKANFDSMVRSHASASRGSSILWNSSVLVLCNITNKICKRTDTTVAFTQEYSKVSYPLGNVSTLSTGSDSPRTHTLV